MLNLSLLDLNWEEETVRIAGFIRNAVVQKLKKKGVVVAVSGGIDSSTTAALSVRALGQGNVLALLMPENDSASESLEAGKLLVKHLGIPHEVINIGPFLEVMGCYRHRDDAIREIFPEYSSDYRSKIVLTSKGNSAARFGFYSIVIQSPDGHEKRQRLSLRNYLQVVAATSMKQRTRKALEYFHADRLNFAVAGTPNLLEYDQGFFVKLGDGAADLKPIAHLYKTQVFRLAEHLGLPDELVQRKSTTDTYSLQQSQEEFYFNVPLEKLDLVMFGVNCGWDPQMISDQSGIRRDEVESIVQDIRQKRAATASLHFPPLSLVPGGRANPEG
ncbi:MAG: NAD(+) synthase [Acidobacteriota bacterium]